MLPTNRPCDTEMSLILACSCATCACLSPESATERCRTNHPTAANAVREPARSHAVFPEVRPPSTHEVAAATAVSRRQLPAATEASDLLQEVSLVWLRSHGSI